MNTNSTFLRKSYESVSPRRRREVVSTVERPRILPVQDENRHSGLKRLKSRSWSSVRRWEKENELLFAMIEDEADWLGGLFPDEIIAPEFFFFALEDGVLLCKLANLIQNHAEKYGEVNRINIPNYVVKYHPRNKTRGQLGQFRARENVTEFLLWCRKHNVPEVILFESNDVVQTEELREGAREVVICLMEVARRSVKFGVKPPKLILLEKEIELEERQDDCGSPTSVDSGVDTENFSSHRNLENAESSLQGSVYKSDQVEDITDGVFLPDGKSFSVATDSFNEKSTITAEQDCKQNGLDVPHKPQSQLDEKVLNLIKEYSAGKITRLKEGKYIILGRVMFVRMLNEHVLVRIGGGWDGLEHYLMTHVKKGASTNQPSSQDCEQRSATPTLLPSSRVQNRAAEKESISASTPSLPDINKTEQRAFTPPLLPNFAVKGRESPCRKPFRVKDTDEADIVRAIRKIESTVSENISRKTSSTPSLNLTPVVVESCKKCSDNQRRFRRKMATAGLNSDEMSQIIVSTKIQNEDSNELGQKSSVDVIDIETQNELDSVVRGSEINGDSKSLQTFSENNNLANGSVSFSEEATPSSAHDKIEFEVHVSKQSQKNISNGKKPGSANKAKKAITTVGEKTTKTTTSAKTGKMTPTSSKKPAASSKSSTAASSKTTVSKSTGVKSASAVSTPKGTPGKSTSTPTAKATPAKPTTTKLGSKTAKDDSTKKKMGKDVPDGAAISKATKPTAAAPSGKQKPGEASKKTMDTPKTTKDKSASSSKPNAKAPGAASTKPAQKSATKPSSASSQAPKPSPTKPVSAAPKSTSTAKPSAASKPTKPSSAPTASKPAKPSSAPASKPASSSSVSKTAKSPAAVASKPAKPSSAPAASKPSSAPAASKPAKSSSASAATKPAKAPSTATASKPAKPSSAPAKGPSASTKSGKSSSTVTKQSSPTPPKSAAGKSSVKDAKAPGTKPKSASEGASSKGKKTATPTKPLVTASKTSEKSKLTKDSKSSKGAKKNENKPAKEPLSKAEEAKELEAITKLEEKVEDSEKDNVVKEDDSKKQEVDSSESSVVSTDLISAAEREISSVQFGDSAQEGDKEVPLILSSTSETFEEQEKTALVSVNFEDSEMTQIESSVSYSVESEPTKDDKDTSSLNDEANVISPIEDAEPNVPANNLDHRIVDTSSDSLDVTHEGYSEEPKQIDTMLDGDMTTQSDSILQEQLDMALQTSAVDVVDQPEREDEDLSQSESSNIEEDFKLFTGLPAKLEQAEVTEEEDVLEQKCVEELEAASNLQENEQDSSDKQENVIEVHSADDDLTKTDSSRSVELSSSGDLVISVDEEDVCNASDNIPKDAECLDEGKTQDDGDEDLPQQSIKDDAGELMSYQSDDIVSQSDIGLKLCEKESVEELEEGDEEALESKESEKFDETKLVALEEIEGKCDEDDTREGAIAPTPPETPVPGTAAEVPMVEAGIRSIETEDDVERDDNSAPEAELTYSQEELHPDAVSMTESMAESPIDQETVDDQTTDDYTAVNVHSDIVTQPESGETLDEQLQSRQTELSYENENVECDKEDQLKGEDVEIDGDQKDNVDVFDETPASLDPIASLNNPILRLTSVDGQQEIVESEIQEFEIENDTAEEIQQDKSMSRDEENQLMEDTITEKETENGEEEVQEQSAKSEEECYMYDIGSRGTNEVMHRDYPDVTENAGITSRAQDEDAESSQIEGLDDGACDDIGNEASNVDLSTDNIRISDSVQDDEVHEDEDRGNDADVHRDNDENDAVYSDGAREEDPVADRLQDAESLDTTAKDLEDSIEIEEDKIEGTNEKEIRTTATYSPDDAENTEEDLGKREDDDHDGVTKNEKLPLSLPCDDTTSGLEEVYTPVSDLPDDVCSPFAVISFEEQREEISQNEDLERTDAGDTSVESDALRHAQESLRLARELDDSCTEPEQSDQPSEVGELAVRCDAFSSETEGYLSDATAKATETDATHVEMNHSLDNVEEDGASKTVLLEDGTTEEMEDTLQATESRDSDAVKPNIVSSPPLSSDSEEFSDDNSECCDDETSKQQEAIAFNEDCGFAQKSPPEESEYKDKQEEQHEEVSEEKDSSSIGLHADRGLTYEEEQNEFSKEEVQLQEDFENRFESEEQGNVENVFSNEEDYDVHEDVGAVGGNQMGISEHQPEDVKNDAIGMDYGVIEVSGDVQPNAGEKFDSMVEGSSKDLATTEEVADGASAAVINGGQTMQGSDSEETVEDANGQLEYDDSQLESESLASKPDKGSDDGIANDIKAGADEAATDGSDFVLLDSPVKDSGCLEETKTGADDEELSDKSESDNSPFHHIEVHDDKLTTDHDLHDSQDNSSSEKVLYEESSHVEYVEGAIEGDEDNTVIENEAQRLIEGEDCHSKNNESTILMGGAHCPAMEGENDLEMEDGDRHMMESENNLVLEGEDRLKMEDENDLMEEIDRPVVGDDDNLVMESRGRPLVEDERGLVMVEEDRFAVEDESNQLTEGGDHPGMQDESGFVMETVDSRVVEDGNGLVLDDGNQTVVKDERCSAEDDSCPITDDQGSAFIAFDHGCPDAGEISEGGHAHSYGAVGPEISSSPPNWYEQRDEPEIATNSDARFVYGGNVDDDETF